MDECERDSNLGRDCGGCARAEAVAREGGIARVGSTVTGRRRREGGEVSNDQTMAARRVGRRRSKWFEDVRGAGSGGEVRAVLLAGEVRLRLLPVGEMAGRWREEPFFSSKCSEMLVCVWHCDGLAGYDCNGTDSLLHSSRPPCVLGRLHVDERPPRCIDSRPSSTRHVTCIATIDCWLAAGKLSPAIRKSWRPHVLSIVEGRRLRGTSCSLFLAPCHALDQWAATGLRTAMHRLIPVRHRDPHSVIEECWMDCIREGDARWVDSVDSSWRW